MTTVVRVCEATYDAALVVKEGIQVLVSGNPRSRLEALCLVSEFKDSDENVSCLWNENDENRNE